VKRIAVVGIVTLIAAGCGSERNVVGKWVAGPTAEVEALELTAASPAATTGNLIVKLTNPNDAPLPLPMAQYTVTLGGTTYSTDTVPNATLPALGEQRIVLPVVFTEPANTSFDARGSVTYIPPGEIRALLSDIGIPLPTASFNGSGDAMGQPVSVIIEPVAPIEQAPASNAVDEAVETMTEPIDEAVNEMEGDADEASYEPAADDAAETTPDK